MIAKYILFGIGAMFLVLVAYEFVTLGNLRQSRKTYLVVGSIFMVVSGYLHFTS